MLMQLQQPIGTIRLGESFDYAREIARPFGQIDCIIEWCKTELTGDWRWQVVTSSSDRAPGRYIFYFDSDRDAAAFSLFWA
jgi:hypothetical protein